ncbi:extracellular solute-binding protein [Oerskovia turbata]|uniref:Extracellular solute-binding protein n=1 Tax=Oerskovia turbata TaxID=1713 RepID=A0A4Q1KVX4_9CELL|nr:extracellular solute-binding protein [Oerskovia turbata]RXR26645.1 extracellular solute-binding protein [Oerskovia turbata]RXR34342.1 extracellular solute-binding protein [Oerskovia turbata]TGJ97647.1 sugar ABC transporter substrate-binding protein [Actinotalea fermentans ATCC 43279 = JCM 9966 = DSM 3133]
MLRTRKPLVAALVALPLALAGCAGGGSGGGDSDDTTLTIWHYESETSAMGQAWAKAIEIFEDENPDVTVDVQKQTFEQIQKNAKIVLTGDDVPDVMEYNKGNATAGQLASQGLLTPLTDAAKERGWDTTLSGSLQTTATYDENGLMGSGDWYGVPNYGEFVGVYYNKDMFAQYGVEVPTTLAELETAMATFQAAGVIPLAEAGAEYPLGQLWYELVLANADQDFVDAYQLFDGDVDFQGPEMTEATETLADWIDKGYIASDSAALTAEDMGVSFINGTYPMMVSGSWWFGRIVDEMDADWGQFNFPGNTLQVGSSGNLWVVPTNADSKSLAEEFIDITLRPEVQNILGEAGGLPVAGDVSAITDERTKALTQNFNDILAADGLAFYPDWPVAGYYDVLVSQLQSLVNRSKTPAEVLDGLSGPYEEGKADLLEG